MLPPEEANAVSNENDPRVERYVSVPFNYLLAVLLEASRRGVLEAALHNWRKPLRKRGDGDVLFPQDYWEAGKKAFQEQKICAGVTGVAGVIIQNLTVTVVLSPPGLDVTFNALCANSFPCGAPALASMTLTVIPPPPAPPATLSVTAGPPPALPAAIAPAPAGLTDVPTSGNATIPSFPPVMAGLAASITSLVGVQATLTAVYNVADTGGVCDTCSQSPSLTVSATTTTV
jgi:hypothetical protein